MAADFHQMPQDLANSLRIGDIDNQFTIPQRSIVYYNRLYLTTAEGLPPAAGVQTAVAARKSGSEP